MKKRKSTDWRQIKDLVELMYSAMPNRDLAELLGLPVDSVVSAGKNWGLKKDASVIRAMKSSAALASVAARRETLQKNRDNTPKPLGGNLPPRLTDAQLARRKKERFVYAPDALPWRAHKMFGPVYVPPALSYRGQRA